MENILNFDNFKTISDFKWSLKYGGEIQFDWNGQGYGVFSKLRLDTDQKIFIGKDYIEGEPEDENWYDTIDEVLDHVIDGQKLREIITQVQVVWRMI